MENSLVTYGFNKTEKESHTLSGSVISVVWLFVSAHSLHQVEKKIIGNVTAKNYLKESLSSIFCFIIQGKRVLHGKGLSLKFIFLQLRMVI